MSDGAMSGRRTQGRLSTLSAALVVARRDFVAVLWSRSFLAFLLGPLFMLGVTTVATSVGRKVDESAANPVLGVMMSKADTTAILTAGLRLTTALDGGMPDLVAIESSSASPAEVLSANRATINAVLSGTPDKPVLTGPPDLIDSWRGPVSVLITESRGDGPQGYTHVTMTPTGKIGRPDERVGRMRTAQAAQTTLFLLTMLLAGMVLSNLVEEKGNKIIEILAAAIPMDAVFLGKLFAMLAVSFVGIAVWGTAIGTILLAGGRSLTELPAPAVGWPVFFLLGGLYFAMAYLLLGSVFLTIGSMASTVREVQTLSMPVTMMQLLVFFFSTYAMAMPGSMIEKAAAAVPFSSPFVMLARAAQDPGITQHLIALAWQAVWVALFIRFGARLFRRKVMKSGPAGGGKRRSGGLFRRAKAT